MSVSPNCLNHMLRATLHILRDKIDLTKSPRQNSLPVSFKHLAPSTVSHLMNWSWRIANSKTTRWLRNNSWSLDHTSVFAKYWWTRTYRMHVWTRYSPISVWCRASTGIKLRPDSTTKIGILGVIVGGCR